MLLQRFKGHSFILLPSEYITNNANAELAKQKEAKENQGSQYKKVALATFFAQFSMTPLPSIECIMDSSASHDMTVLSLGNVDVPNGELKDVFHINGIPINLFSVYHACQQEATVLVSTSTVTNDLSQSSKVASGGDNTSRSLPVWARKTIETTSSDVGDPSETRSTCPLESGLFPPWCWNSWVDERRLSRIAWNWNLCCTLVYFLDGVWVGSLASYNTSKPNVTVGIVHPCFVLRVPLMDPPPSSITFFSGHLSGCIYSIDSPSRYVDKDTSLVVAFCIVSFNVYANWEKATVDRPLTSSVDVSTRR
eukprot:Gb_21140 [translate_table: standard]